MTDVELLTEYERRQLNVQLNQLSTSIDDNFLKLVETLKLRPWADFIGADLRDMDFSSLVLEGYNFENADFRGSNLNGTRFRSCTLQGAIFDTGTSLDTTQFTEQTIQARPEFDQEDLDLIQQAINAPKYQQRSKALRALAGKLPSKPRLFSYFESRAINDKSAHTRNIALQSIVKASSTPKEDKERLLKIFIQKNGDEKATHDALGVLKDTCATEEYVAFVMGIAHRSRIAARALLDLDLNSKIIEDKLHQLAIWSDHYDVQAFAITHLAQTHANEHQSALLVRDIALGKYNETQNYRDANWPYVRTQALDSHVRHLPVDLSLIDSISDYILEQRYGIDIGFWMSFIDKYEAHADIEGQINRKFATMSSYYKEDLFLAYCYLKDREIGELLVSSAKSREWFEPLFDEQGTVDPEVTSRISRALGIPEPSVDSRLQELFKALGSQSREHHESR